jgi:hypothetical protein
MLSKLVWVLSVSFFYNSMLHFILKLKDYIYICWLQQFSWYSNSEHDFLASLYANCNILPAKDIIFVAFAYPAHKCSPN